MVTQLCVCTHQMIHFQRQLPWEIVCGHNGRDENEIALDSILAQTHIAYKLIAPIQWSIMQKIQMSDHQTVK